MGKYSCHFIVSEFVPNSPSKKRSLVGIAGIVAIATIISKLIGLLRQQAIAAAFAVGPVADAFNFSYVVPGFLFILLGGINGPFHSAMVSVLSRCKREDAAPVVETITTLVGGLLLLVAVGLVLFADPLLSVVAPGLNVSLLGEGVLPERVEAIRLTREIAVQQLQVMAPMAVFAGLIGIGFGVLNAADQYWLPSISPLFSSLTVLIALGVVWLQHGSEMTAPQYALSGGLALAWGTLAGAVLQWLIQLPAQWRSGLGGLRLRFDFHRPEVREILGIMGPATFSSGMLQINLYTDLFFASFIPQAAAALGYAGLVAITPLGILSNMILVPFLPVFSRLTDPQDWPELKVRIRQALMFSAVSMLPLGAMIIALSMPIVQVVYERGAFLPENTRFVASVMVPYGIGMFAYLGRDVLVRVFYALGDGETPFRVSVANIFLNGVLDWVLIQGFGAPGLVLATVGVNVASMIVLLWVLDRRLGGLPLREWSVPFSGLLMSSVVAGLVAWGIQWGCQQVLGPMAFLPQLGVLCLAGFVGLGVFMGIASQLRVPEVAMVVDRVRQRLAR